MTIPHSFIQELLSRIDIVDVIAKHVQLKKGGANFMGLCPFHGEKSPSFSVNPIKQFYHCFGCHASGDAIQFLTEFSGSSFIEAVEDLAQQVGLSVPNDFRPQNKVAAQQQKEIKLTLHEILETAGESWRKELKNHPHAIEYLKKRGISGEISKAFGLGYAPFGWRNLARVFPDYNDSLLEQSGLVIDSASQNQNQPNSEDQQNQKNNSKNNLKDKENQENKNDSVISNEHKRYDRFRDRIMFPIRNSKGEYIGFGGRVLDQSKPKYLNSPETPIFSKGRELYGLFEAKKAIRERNFVLVTEGYMDVIALAQWGFANSVATLGTACTADHIRMLFRLTQSIVFAFDGDNAGQNAAKRALEIALPFAEDTRSIKFLFLPSEHDPDSFIRTNGQAAFGEFINKATPLSRFLLEIVKDQCDQNTIEGRSRISDNAKPFWDALPEGVFKRQMLSELAALIQMQNADLLSAWQNQPVLAKSDLAFSVQQSSGFQNSKTPKTFKSSKTNKRNHKEKASFFNVRNAAKKNTSDLIACLLLSNMQLLETLSHEDRDLLCHLPSWHSELFQYLESQWHEHGVLSWIVLKQDLNQQWFHQKVEQLTQEVFEEIEEKPEELHQLVMKLKIEKISEQLEQILQNIQQTSDTDQKSQLKMRYQELLLAQTHLKKQSQTLQKAAAKIL